MGEGNRLNALQVIRRVEMLGGRLVVEDEQLKLRAPDALPPDVIQAVQEQKASIMIALGAPVDTVVGSILEEIRPQLPASLRKLADDRLLALVNWSIMASWEKTIAKLRVGGRNRPRDAPADAVWKR